MENIKLINKIRIKRKEKQLLLRFVTGILIFSILLNVGIAALYPQVIYASFAGTVAGYILTLFASFNTAITNPNVVEAINNTFGSMALEAADAGVIDQGIAQIASSTGFDMASIFSNTASEAEQLVAAGWEGISTTAQTAGQNLAAGATACAASAGAVLPALAGTVLPAAGAVAAGVGLGFLIDHIKNKVADYIKYSKEMDTPSKVMDMLATGNYGNAGTVTWKSSVGYLYWNCSPNVICATSPSTTAYYAYDSTGWFNFITPSGSTNHTNISANYGGTNALGVPCQGMPYFNTTNEAYTYVSNRANYNKNRNTSPDLIGNIGNQTGYDDNGNYILPNITNIYDYGNTVINYIDPNDYQDFVDRANDNTDLGDTGEDTQGEDFDTFISPYIQPIENQPQEPELPNPQPTIAPSNPTIPVQPTAAPEPTLTPEETDEMPHGMTQPKITDKFPFCIPFDIAYLFAILSDEREAPNFVWTLDLGSWGHYEIDIDLTPFNSVASIFRLCELILFILGLMLITKSLLSSNDGG